MLGHHWHQFGPKELQPLEWLLRRGWAGVDLFFVLSGFLVSGLLFREYRQRRGVDVRRFLIRRAFKIYPGFYCMIALTATAMKLGAFHTEELSPRTVLAELFFVQNYLGGIWNHTWSLGVEEHFYLLLCAVALLIVRKRPDDDLRGFPRFVAAACAFALLARMWVYYEGGYSWRSIYAPTHTRVDALSFGVLLCWLQHFRPAEFTLWTERRRPALFAIALAALAPFLFLEQSDPYLFLFGISALYAGCGLLLVLFVTAKLKGPRLLWSGLARIGEHSYSIYLWHMAVLLWSRPVLEGMLGRPVDAFELLGAFVLGSIGVGVLFAKLLELPALRLRDRLFPSLA